MNPPLTDNIKQKNKKHIPQNMFFFLNFMNLYYFDCIINQSNISKLTGAWLEHNFLIIHFFWGDK